MKMIAVALTSAVLLASTANGQTAAPAPAQIVTLVAGATDAPVLRTGTPVALRLMEELTTQG